MAVVCTLALVHADFWARLQRLTSPHEPLGWVLRARGCSVAFRGLCFFLAAENGEYCTCVKHAEREERWRLSVCLVWIVSLGYTELDKDMYLSILMMSAQIGLCYISSYII